MVAALGLSARPHRAAQARTSPRRTRSRKCVRRSPTRAGQAPWQGAAQRAMEAGRKCQRGAGHLIAKDFITEWREYAPWVTDAQVEQDLVISRAIIEIFRNENLARHLAFRGGTALFKLHLRPAARYSEDIDLVQIAPSPIGEVFDSLRSVLDPWLGEPRRQIKEGSVNLVYRFTSEDEPSKAMRLKIEINSREHFAELGHVRVPFEMKSRCWNSTANVTTFALEELLGTKLRALYQRRKSRDLFDLWYGLTRGGASP